MPAAPVAHAADADDAVVAIDAAPTANGRKKKLILAATALAVLLAAGGGAAYVVIKKRAAAVAAAAEGEGTADTADTAVQDPVEPKLVKADVKHAPTFVPLDPFTVNLADREADRYAQVGITLELADPKAGDLLKAYMPAIRNNILLALGSKTAAQLIERDGKLRLAAEIRREALRPLGYDIVLPAAAAPGGTAARLEAATDDDEETPIRAVHFSNFIIQ
jgi:flagellar protein FliL